LRNFQAERDRELIRFLAGLKPGVSRAPKKTKVLRFKKEIRAMLILETVSYRSILKMKLKELDRLVGQIKG